MPATDADIIKWQLRFLSEEASSLTEGELNLVASFEDQFKRKGSLSERLTEVHCVDVARVIAEAINRDAEQCA